MRDASSSNAINHICVSFCATPVVRLPSPASGPPGGGDRGGEPEEDAHVAFERNGAGYGPGQGMRARDRRKALLAAAVLPYLLAKLDAGHER